MMNGLSTVNVELTTRCNKSCWMCGRRKVEPEPMDMDIALVGNIARELPDGIVVQFHNNGEPLLYSRLGDALKLFEGKIRCLDTNGKLLLEKADEIIGNLESLTLSTFENDMEADEQYEIFEKFHRLRWSHKPQLIVRCLGNVDYLRYQDYPIAKRTLHASMGSFGYEKEPVVPEIGICLEALHHLSINADGMVAPCVRFDPDKENIIGNRLESSLGTIWEGYPRKYILNCHIKGMRDKVPFCAKCHYWGVPTG